MTLAKAHKECKRVSRTLFFPAAIVREKTDDTLSYWMVTTLRCIRYQEKHHPEDIVRIYPVNAPSFKPIYNGN